jgi:hypothetical protein
MKKIILVATTILFNTFFCVAQINKGIISLGANTGFGLNQSYYESGFKTTDYNISIRPYFEGFLANNLSIGLTVNAGIGIGNYTSSSSSSDYNSKSFGFELFLKRYWFFNPNVAFNLSPYLSANRSFYSQTNTNTGTSNSNYESDYKLYNAGIQIGTLIMLKPNFGLELQTNLLGYTKQIDNSDRQYDNFSIFNFQSGLTLGVKFLINKPKEQEVLKSY